MVDQPMTLTFDDLMKLPMEDHDVTLTCVSESVGGGYIGNARWQGTLLAPLLKKAGVQKGADADRHARRQRDEPGRRDGPGDGRAGVACSRSG